MHEQSRTETATLGGGCFWCLEAVYNELRGVERVISGYAGSSVPFPTYEQVCSGRAGHAEVVQVLAQTVMDETNASGIWRSPLVTQLELLDRFYPAEGYHQNYFERNQFQPYCQMVIAPKVAKVRQRYLARLKRTAQANS